MLQDQQQTLLTVLQQQQRTQTELQAQNRELQQQMLGATGNTTGTVTRQPPDSGAARIPATSLPEKAVYGMSLQQWRIWRRDILQFAQMSQWSAATTVANIRLQCGDKIERIIEAQYGDRWADLSVQGALDAIESILKKSSNPAKERSKFHLMYQYDGQDQMRALHLTEGSIDPADANLRHAGGGALKVLGSKTCHLRVGDRVTTELVFFVRALIQYHNTPLRDGNKSPAQLLMGRQLRGGVPVAKVHLQVAEHWTDYLAEREERMAERITRAAHGAKMMADATNVLARL
ncbi:hypothetical protein FJT64_012468 [Amphibalanus amphitrite]|uniref:Uncharacterized protein n=1 Tax=Amphibalanus amphitrite TaxID=1232801 RepID=A0A6A4VCH5_AMPAM|nr:hypothetical protein FJT64_012468 [Amphibalanus amphitrite]